MDAIIVFICFYHDQCLDTQHTYTKLLNTEQTKHECSASSLMMMYLNLNYFLEIRTVAPRWSVLPLTSTTSLTWALETASRSSGWWTCPPPWRRPTRWARGPRPPWWPPSRCRESSRCSVSPLGSCHLPGFRPILHHHSDLSATQRWVRETTVVHSHWSISQGILCLSVCCPCTERIYHIHMPSRDSGTLSAPLCPW